MVHKCYCKVLQEITIKSKIVFFVDVLWSFFLRGYVCGFDAVTVKMHAKCFMSYHMPFCLWPLRPVMNEVTQISLLVRLHLKY